MITLIRPILFSFLQSEKVKLLLVLEGLKVGAMKSTLLLKSTNNSN
jgi:hypothetical protein